MWCDRFDADLLAVVPGAAAALGGLAQLELSTFSGTDEAGVINHPSAWWTDWGLAAFFWTRPDGRPAEAYHTAEPVVSCTLLEAVRDEWVHGCLVVVDRRLIWSPPPRLFDTLMWDLRGWATLTDGERNLRQAAARRSLKLAAQRLAAARRHAGG